MVNVYFHPFKMFRNFIVYNLWMIVATIIKSRNSILKRQLASLLTIIINFLNHKFNVFGWVGRWTSLFLSLLISLRSTLPGYGTTFSKKNRNKEVNKKKKVTFEFLVSKQIPRSMDCKQSAANEA